MTDTTVSPASDGGAPAIRRNVAILAFCQALSQTGATMTITVSALAGHMLATNKAMATVPFALQFTLTMVATIPASLLMGRIGRRAGFTVGQCIGIVGAMIAVFGIVEHSFWIFALGSAVIGIHNAFWQYYRFAAADASSEAYRSRAISYVMAGGLIAAVAGPQLAKLTRDVLTDAVFAGSYATFVVLCLAAIAMVQGLKIPKPALSHISGAGRKLSEIAVAPVFLVAVMAGMIGYGSMNLVMTATPLAMTHAQHGFGDTAFVIQWHVLAMFAPSFFTGHLIKRFGVLHIIIAGALLMIACMTVNLQGEGLWYFWTGLVLLGLGWNFMFIGGTTLLTEAYKPIERAKVQAANDFLVFAAVSLSSFSSGALHHALGWQAVNFGILLPVLGAFAGAAWLLLKRRRERGLG